MSSFAIASPSCHKRQRPSTDVDRLSSLPESVLCHILSLLPTEDVVATSLLSKRWKFLWKNIHNLIFNDIARKATKIKFAHFVNKVLIFLNEQTIDKFSLKIDKYCEVYDFTTWIATAVGRNVKVLVFCLRYQSSSDPYIKLPCSLFTCKSLEVLVLRGGMSLNVPSLVFLPNLKTLRLEFVRYRCDESVRNLISGCSSLETLYIQRHLYDDVVTFTISSPTLKNLTFLFYQTRHIFRKEIDYKLEINAPALTYLHLSDTLSRDFSIGNLCSLEKAHLWRKNIKDRANVPLIDNDRYSKSVLKLLQGVHNVKYLLLRDDILKAFSHAGVVPSFRRLTRLGVEVEYCGWNSLLDLVKRLNTLEFLVIKYFGHKDAHVTCWSEPEKVPICFLSCFHKMSIHEFEGMEDELAMVAYILKHAKVLRTMTIKAANTLDLEAKFQLLQKISMFPRGSEKCEITFY